MSEPEWAAAFVDALTSVGIGVHMPERPVRDKDLPDVVIDVQGRRFAVDLKYVHTPTPLDLEQRIVSWQPKFELSDSISVLVGERISKGARKLLLDHGWGWLDLRGHLRLAGPGLLVDTPVTPFRARPKRSGALAGSAGIDVSSFLLLHPDRRPTVREVAREVRRSPSTVSEIFKAFRGEGILGEDGTVAHRDLFWRLAESWDQESVGLASMPEPGRASVNVALQLGLEGIESTSGWALTDARAAALYGAPIGVRDDYPPDFYVPARRVLDRAVKLLGEAPGSSGRKASLKLAPTPMVCEQRIDAARRHIGDEVWPLAHPLFVALDLATDPGRGTEILTEWNPPKPWRRVW